ncbi:MAG: hypothetical protein H5T86_05405 [Armatimonadetes bacterium]|nr:hypothetical protein [Armatimonadota bacterium]
MAKAREVRLERDFPGARQVYIAGDFNGWDPRARRMKRVREGEDRFVARLTLLPGRYEFKYVVDGEWMCDPFLPRVPNQYGTENSVLTVE